ncbi:hypothetical protein DL93DRAFT_2124906 [Clavulina sp. PMI_390]|nr:hypothetical protein DL93DRAFT_2124906 [Clavulina sp. PMI_390]
MVSGLNQNLLRSLASLPDSRTFHLYTIISEAKRDQDLFLYAPHRPRAHVRHILVLLSQSPPSSAHERVFICAIEAFLYIIPSTQSSILYISKVDSTGQGTSIRPNPTKNLVSAFISYMSAPSSRPTPYLWINIFARAQNQYIFPNSAEHPGKRVLRDINLCKWWKETLESAVSRVAGSSNAHLFYLLPGYSYLEAMTMLHKSGAAPSISPSPHGNPPQWTYGHPYHQSSAPFPSTLIPSLPDDPKARFLDEIASTTSEDLDAPTALPTSSAPPTKRQRVNSPNDSKSASSSASSAAKGKGKALQVTPAAQRALAAVSIDEFWERMAFRQECSQGAVTGFFTAILSPQLPVNDAQIPQEASQAGLDDPLVPTSGVSATPLRPTYSLFSPENLESFPGQQPIAVLDRVISTLMNLDFGSTEMALRATRVVEDSIRVICGVGPPPDDPRPQAEASSGSVDHALTAPLSAVSSNTTELNLIEDPSKVSPTEAATLAVSTPVNPTPLTDSKRESSQTRAHSFIYGTITIHNPPPPPRTDAPPKEPVVTVLQVRKKKRPAPLTAS